MGCAKQASKEVGWTNEKFSDEETKQTIAKVYKEHEYILDPHGAVGYLALEKYLQEHPAQKRIFFRNCSPGKISGELFSKISLAFI